MKCPKCQCDNREGAKFCGKCRAKLLLLCPQCNSENPPDNLFCDECGLDLKKGQEPRETAPLPEGERKYVTVLFSDLSGYTAMSEKLDPEEVKEITSGVFGEIAKVIDRYEGFVEKYAGDAVMALFGVPEAHEDDPLRAIRAAREIHELVRTRSPQVEQKTGKALSLHTGINTGLVVTGEVNLEKGTHGAAGDTINVAARFSSLAEAGEILVGRETYRQAQGYVDFEEVEPVTVKGREEPVKSFRVISLRDKPVTLHRLSGLKSELIGRKAEVAELKDAVDLLKGGKGRIFSICGDAGTGKSRLVQEFRESLDPGGIQWLEAHAYAYTQNVPYYPLMDLFNRSFGIEEGDRPKRIQEKIESALKSLIGEREDLIPYVGSLYSLNYPEVDEVSPEFWKARLQEAVKGVLSALALRGPTIFFLEDLHWADPSFVELLRTTLQEIRNPAVVLCVYRPSFTLFTSHQLEVLKGFYREIRLQDLSASEALDMLESLLQTDQVPSELGHFVRDKAEGNPFYLEELINSLIESDTLVKDNGTWKLTGPITESSISSTIHGLITGRLDRLERETKRVLQEASVIGRSFLFDILKRVTEIQDQVERCLIGLERLDLIRTRSLQPDLEYIFKHALTQEVVYNGLLKKERKEIHERIAQVMEQLFQDRLPEFYEALAYHYKQGESALKAVDYLMKAGEKSLKRYAVEEAHKYYEEAYEVLTGKPDSTTEDDNLLVGLLLQWALVFYYRGDFKSLDALLSQYSDMAERLDDHQRGMYYGWLGFTLYARERFRESYTFLHQALRVGESSQDQQIIGYACTWLTWTCGELGLMAEAIVHGERAQEIYQLFPNDHYLYFKSLAGIAQAYLYSGKTKEVFSATEDLLDYGRKHVNARSLYLGHTYKAFALFASGDFSAAEESCLKAIHVSVDPYYMTAGKLLLGFIRAYVNEFEEIDVIAREVDDFCRRFGCELRGTSAHLLLGILHAVRGQLGLGLKMIEEARDTFSGSGRKYYLAMTELIIANIYLQIAKKSAPITLSIAAKNIGFLLKNIPTARRKAEAHLTEAFEVAQDIGANAIMGQSYLERGLLHQAMNRDAQAKECLVNAVQLLRECGAEGFLKQAKEALASLK